MTVMISKTAGLICETVLLLQLLEMRCTCLHISLDIATAALVDSFKKEEFECPYRPT